MKKTGRIYLIIFLTIILIAGCSSSTYYKNIFNMGKSQPENNTKQKIRFWMRSSSNNNVQAKMIEAFNREHGDIEVEYEVFGDNYMSMLNIALKSGNPPDIFELQSSPTVPELVEGGFVESLDNYLTKEFKAKFYPEVFLDKECIYKDHIYAIPERYTYYTLLYNKSIFKKSGLDPNRPPKTLEELREYARKITNAGDGKFYGFALPLKSINSVWSMTLDNMAAMHAMTADSAFDWSTGRFDFMKQKPFLEFMISLKKDGSILSDPMDMDEEIVRVHFANNRVGMIIDGNFMNTIYKNEVKNYADWDFARIPTFSGTSSAKGILYLTQARLISKASKNKETAWKVIEYIFEHQDMTIKEEDTKSTIIKANEVPLPMAERKSHEKMLDLQLYYTNFRIAPHRFIDIQGIDRDHAYLSIYHGDLDMDDTLKNLTLKYNKALDDAIKSEKIEWNDVVKEGFNYYLR